MPHITSIKAEIVDVPQNVVFETAKSRTDVAQALNVLITSDEGLTGRGEGTPAEYVTGETRETVTRDVNAASAKLAGWDVNKWRGFCQEVRGLLPNSATACAALEIAIVDLYCQSHNTSMADFFGGVRKSVISDYTIPIVAPDLAFNLAKEASATFSSLKIKVGGPNRDEDLERVRQIHLAAPQAKIRIDANQGFDAAGAIKFVADLNHLGISPEIVEQPVPKQDIQALKQVKDGIPEPVIADEAAVNPQGVLKLIRAEAVDGVNIKLMKAGFTGALDIIAMCRAAGLKLMIGCMLETPVGIGAGVHLACGTGAFDYLDLDADVLGKPTGIQQNYRRNGEELIPL